MGTQIRGASIIGCSLGEHCRVTIPNPSTETIGEGCQISDASKMITIWHETGRKHVSRCVGLNLLEMLNIHSVQHGQI